MHSKFVWIAPIFLALATAGQAAVVSGNPLDNEGLAREVYRRIEQAWGGDTASLTVAAERGLVVLTGEAPSPPLARQAEDIAEATPGVVEVMNRLETRLR